MPGGVERAHQVVAAKAQTRPWPCHAREQLGFGEDAAVARRLRTTRVDIQASAHQTRAEPTA
jgi:hypothetical protein